MVENIEMEAYYEAMIENLAELEEVFEDDFLLIGLKRILAE